MHSEKFLLLVGPYPNDTHFCCCDRETVALCSAAILFRGGKEFGGWSGREMNKGALSLPPAHTTQGRPPEPDDRTARQLRRPSGVVKRRKRGGKCLHTDSRILRTTGAKIAKSIRAIEVCC